MALDDVIRERDAFVDSMEDGLKRALETLQAQFVRSAPRDLAFYRDANLVFRLLLDSGLEEIIDSLPFPQRSRFVRDVAVEVGANPDDIDSLSIRGARLANLGFIEAVSREAANAIRSNLLLANLQRSPRSVSDIVDSVRGAVGGAVFANGRLEVQVNTAMAVFDQQIQDEIAEQTGFDQFIYSGPSDALIRPFCRSLIAAHKTYTAAGIEKLNGHPDLHRYVPPNVRVFRGGLNCRHMWVAVDPKFARDEGFKPAE